MASKFWVLSNEDSKASFFRKTHADTHKGNWEYTPSSGWKWIEEVNTDIPIPVKKAEEKIEVTENKVEKTGLFKRKRKTDK